MKAITTVWSQEGEVYRASDMDGNRVSVCVFGNDGANTEAGHRLAAQVLIQKMGWGPVGIVSGAVKDGYVHCMLPTRQRPFPRYFRHVTHPVSDAVYLRFDSKDAVWVVTREGQRKPNSTFSLMDMLALIDFGECIELTEREALNMLEAVTRGVNVWKTSTDKN